MSGASTPCPLCGDPLQRPMQVDVCGTCYHDLHVAGAVDLQATGEFSAVQRDHGGAAPAAGGPPRPARARTAAPGTEATCTWCQKPRHEVRTLLASGDARICNECVALCADVLESELGAGWR